MDQHVDVDMPGMSGTTVMMAVGVRVRDIVNEVCRRGLLRRSMESNLGAPHVHTPEQGLFLCVVALWERSIVCPLCN